MWVCRAPRSVLKCAASRVSSQGSALRALACPKTERAAERGAARRCGCRQVLCARSIATKPRSAPQSPEATQAARGSLLAAAAPLRPSNGVGQGRGKRCAVQPVSRRLGPQTPAADTLAAAGAGGQQARANGRTLGPQCHPVFEATRRHLESLRSLGRCRFACRRRRPFAPASPPPSALVPAHCASCCKSKFERPLGATACAGEWPW